MPWGLKGTCVHKLNPDGSLGPVVKCHATRAQAEAHRRALYANMDDSERHAYHDLPGDRDTSAFFEPFSRYEFADAKSKEKKNKPYGDVKYADPKNGKYPIDTEAHIRAAWSYINMPKNSAKYPLNGVSLASVKARIRAAMRRIGATVS